MTPEHSLTETALMAALTEVRDAILLADARAEPVLARVHTAFSSGARNMTHYVALRALDLRPLQDSLVAAGLSSLGRSEANVLASVETVLNVVERLCGAQRSKSGTELQLGRAQLAANTERLLGAEPAERAVRVMVTLPTEAADDPQLVLDLVRYGMDCARINTAHDSPDAWLRMIQFVRSAENSLGRRCCVLMDLAGVKLRTVALEYEPAVIKLKPLRDREGVVVRPARVLLGPNVTDGRVSADAALPLPLPFVLSMRVGDVVHFVDLRGKKRRLRIVEEMPWGRVGELKRTCYLGTRTALRVRGKRNLVARIGPLPDVAREIVLTVNDRLILAKAAAAAHNALLPRFSIRPLEVLKLLEVGQHIWFDDGKIGGIVEATNVDEVQVRITSAAPRGSRLRAEKGINLPEADITLPALTDEDKQCLDFVVAHADLVGLSFANQVSDVRELVEELARRGDTHLGLVIKVETQLGFRNLPQLLLEAMRLPRVGVMIARGDLAVECGFERLAEVQEEILWLCEAAQVPCIWATQVLESLVKQGQPSRAEITDASTASRAECVMLNKGPYIVQAVAALDDILRRMQEHVTKKTSRLRLLQSFRM